MVAFGFIIILSLALGLTFVGADDFDDYYGFNGVIGEADFNVEPGAGDGGVDFDTGEVEDSSGEDEFDEFYDSLEIEIPDDDPSWWEVWYWFSGEDEDVKEGEEFMDEEVESFELGERDELESSLGEGIEEIREAGERDREEESIKGVLKLKIDDETIIIEKDTDFVFRPDGFVNWISNSKREFRYNERGWFEEDVDGWDIYGDENWTAISIEELNAALMDIGGDKVGQIHLVGSGYSEVEDAESVLFYWDSE